MKFWTSRSCLYTESLIFLYCILNFTICLSLNHEGLTLLRFKAKISSDPLQALSNWRHEFGIDSHCSWFGVECSHGHVVALDLKDLCLRGTLAPEIGDLIHLKSIILRNNLFAGVVPIEVASLKGLEVLDLRNNNFTGQAPNVAPTAALLLDNNGWDELSCILCRDSRSVARRRSLQQLFFGFPPDFPIDSIPPPLALSPSAFPPAPAPSDSPVAPLLAPAPADEPRIPSKLARKNHRRLLVPFVAAGGSLLLLVIIGVVLWQCGKVSAVKPWATGLSGQLQRAFVTGVPKLRRSELEAACEGFSNVIGSFPLCSLYKGTLSNGTEIAVVSVASASAKDWSSSLEAQFRNKIAALSKVNHKNFASLLGYCIEDSPFARMMVFEYAPNGTLFEHLHIREAEHLDWATRLRIAMGVAYCLDYMQQLTPPLQHRSLDSSAVYLTEDYAAKVSDFVLWSEAETSESNVYRFGILLLEMVTGRVPGEAFQDLGRGDLVDMVDPMLESYSRDQLGRIGDVIRSCIGAETRRRPSMGQVCARLREITGIEGDGAAPKLSPLWWAELEISDSRTT